jgi:predicted outer membrane repeat protein
LDTSSAPHRTIAPILLSFILASTAHAASGGPDAFGYTYRDSAEPDGPTYEWIDISATGEKVIGNSIGGSLPTEVATVDIDPAHMFYGIASPFLRISRHGYISNDGTDPGDDFTNDCPIDTPPSSGGGSRHVVFHDRIAGISGNWGVYHKFFPTSPHPHYTGRVHVVQWHNVRLVADTTNTPLSFQALLFGNGDVVYQFLDTPPAAASATVGTVYSSGPTRDGLEYSCNGTGASITAGSTVLFEPPTVVVNGDEELITDDPAILNLREAIEAVPSGGKVIFDPSLESVFLNYGLSADKLLAIDGGNGNPIEISSFGPADFTFTGEFATIHNLEAGYLVVEDSGTLVANRMSASGIELETQTSAHAYHTDLNFGGIGMDGDCQLEMQDGTLWRCRGRKYLGGFFAGGAASLTNGASATFLRCVFEENLLESPTSGAREGAAVHLSDSSATFEACKFEANEAVEASTAAGLLWADGDSTAIFRRCAFKDNESTGDDLVAQQSGGQSPTLEFTNCTFIGENLKFLDASDAGFVFCTFAGAGAALVPTDTATASFRACVFDTGSPFGLGGGSTVQSLGYNALTSDPQGNFTEPTDLVTTFLFLGPLTEDDGLWFHPPQPGSPLVDAVPTSESGLPDVDIRGFARPEDADGDSTTAYDIGAVELAPGLVVDTVSNDPGDGLTLEEAISGVPTGGTVYFDSSLAGSTFAPDASVLTLNKSITLDASSLGEPVTLSPPTGGVSVIGYVDLTLRQVDIRGNDAPLNLAGGARLFASDCTFANNTDGAIETSLTSELTLERCRFRNNSKEGNGGAIEIDLDCSVFLTDCTFIGNTAFSGGAISCKSFAFIDATRCLFADNTASTDGFPGATGNRGGAIHQPVGIYLTRFSHCTFVANDANDGPVYHGPVAGGLLEFRHCTITRNKSNFGIGAIQVNGPAPQLVAFDHTILARNWNNSGREPGNYEGPAVTSAGYNLEDGDTVGFTDPTDLQNCDPLLAPLASYGGAIPSVAPLASSPAIDAGDPGFDATGDPQDGRGLSRIVDGDGDGEDRIDIGAQEAGEPIPVGILADEVDGSPPYSLREALALAGDGERILLRRRLNSGVIRLGSATGQGQPLTIDKDVMIDATLLPMGITISGDDETHLVTVTEEADVAFHAVEFVDGSSTNDGGGLLVEGNLLLSQCTVAENHSAGRGGGIYLDGGSLRADNLTIALNDSALGGAALADNPSKRSRLSMIFSTVRDNNASTGTGGLRLGNTAADFELCYVGNNTTGGSTLNNLATLPATTITTLGRNIEDSDQMGFETQFLVSIGQPGPLTDHGGFVRTCAANTQTPRTGGLGSGHTYYDARGYSRSVEITAGGGSITYYDQINAGAHQWRGDQGDLDLDGLPDWWEHQNRTDFRTPDADADPDGDGRDNANEFGALTDPLDPNSLLRVERFEITGPNQAEVEWSSLPGLDYRLMSSPDLLDWSNEVFTKTATPASNSTTETIAVPMPPHTLFFRIETDGPTP